MRKQELEGLIVYHSDLYYRGEAEITDEEFDRLVEELRQLDPDNKLLTKTGWGYELDPDGKVKHIVPVSGITVKMRTHTELNSNLDPYYQGGYVLTPKLDGGSVIIYYRNGKLDMAISRGDGQYGVDITNVIKKVPSVVTELNGDGFNRDFFAIRGEIIIPVNNSLGIKTYRNSAVGFSQLNSCDNYSEDELNEHLFIPYTVLSNEGYDNSKSEDLELLSNLGFLSIYSIKLNQPSKVTETLLYNYDDTKDLMTKSLDSRISRFKLPIDGVVITTEDKSSQIAFKYDSDSIEMEVESVSWQFNRTGRLTPVLNLKPEVFEDGSTVRRCTMNNLEWFRNAQAGIGAKIRVTKSGGIIPKLVDTAVPSDELDIPTYCPECGSTLVQSTHLICTNDVCKGKVKVVYYSLLCRSLPLGMGNSMLCELLDILVGKSSIDDLDHKDMISLMSMIVSGTADNKIELLNDNAKISNVRYNHFTNYLKNFKDTWYKCDMSLFLTTCNIPNLGESNSYSIANGLNETKYESFIQDPKPYSSQIKELSSNYSVCESIVNYHHMMTTLWDLLSVLGTSLVKPAGKGAAIESDLPKVCLTNLGGCPETKAKIAERLKDKYKFVDYVDNTVTKVVYYKSGSSKMAKAEKLGVEVVHYNDFN